MNARKALIMTYTILIVLVIGAVVFSYSYKAGEREAGEKLLHAFYTFNLPTISENDEIIRELTTDEIYTSHTISSSNRQLRVYLKFEGNPVEAKIISHKGNTIYYYLDSAGFDSERTFAFKYEYSMGKIVGVAEYELFLLPQTLREDLK